MIIPLINRKKLISLPSQEESRRIADLLKANKTEYYEKTQRTGGNGTNSNITDLKTSAQAANYGGYTYSGPGGYVYTIYVKRSEYAKAKELIGE